MSKINIHVGLKLPVTGIDYSNIETAIDFETEVDGNITEAIATIEPEIRKWIESKSEAWIGVFSTLIEEQASKLKRGREAYLAQQEEIARLKTKLSGQENEPAV